jgi:hypothetical protein
MSRPARALLFVVVAAACARAPEPRAPESPAPAADPCLVAGTPGRTADTLDVVLDPPPRVAPLPHSGSDWFVSAQVYETLVRLDCSRAPRPGLAESWEREADGRVWTFTLRDDAVFWDASPLAADSIVSRWRIRPAQSARLARAGVTAIDAAGDRAIRLTFAEPTDSAPAILADPGLAPTVDREGVKEMGAGPWRPQADTPSLASLVPSGVGSERRPILRLVAPLRDLRDAIDAGADVVVTADPATLAYARGRPELVILPLPWGRTYVLLSPRPFEPASAAGFGTALARDVVREDARPAEPPYWWDAPCVPASTARPSSGADESHLIYPTGDSAAAALAGRLVALGAVGPRGAVLAVPLPELLARLDAGRLAGAVLPLPRLPPVPCSARPRSLAGWSVVPLVDTRAHLVAPREGPALRQDGFGALRLDSGMARP